MMKRTVSLLLVLCMLLSTLPITAIAEKIPGESITRQISTDTSVLLSDAGEANISAPKDTIVPLISDAYSDTLSWSYDASTYTLTISGIGAMPDDGISAMPWAKYQPIMKHLIVENGITAIGKNAFYNCSCLTTVT